MPLTQLKVGSGDIVEQFTRGFQMGVDLEDRKQMGELRDLQMMILRDQLRERGIKASFSPTGNIPGFRIDLACSGTSLLALKRPSASNPPRPFL